MTQPASTPEVIYCLAHCRHRAHRPDGEACRTACPLDLPYLVRGEDGIEYHMEGEVHLLDPASLVPLLEDKFMVHLFRLGVATLSPGHITPDREILHTGSAVLDRDGDWVLLRLYGKTYRTWATVPGWLKDLVAGRLVLAPVRELIDEVLR